MAAITTEDVLSALAASDGPLLSSEAFPQIPATAVKSVLDRLKSRDMLAYKAIDREEFVLSKEAEGIVANGSHEARVFEAVRQAVDGLKLSDLQDVVGKESAKVGQGKAFAAGWIKKDPKDKNLLRAEADTIEDKTREQLSVIGKEKNHPDRNVLADLKKRKLVTPRKVLSYRFEKGPKFAREFVKEETDLTADMIAKGTWNINLKAYNFDAKGVPPPAGALHPLAKVRTDFRNIFFEMGFTEMPTNTFVETGFWNFDTLYVPQQHPARDLHDTFYISDPPRGEKPRQALGADDEKKLLDFEQYWNDIRAVHQDGKFGSVGYRYPWNEEEALRLVMRTHTTATSAHMLHQLAADPKSARYFSIDRVFRNEAVDATHLAEFHQIEGVIAEYGLTLGGLIYFLEDFYKKIGIRKLRFKPAYNPYTEPSMEIFGYHEGLKKWVEVGNCGMFRPEMLLPMGLPADLRVYGWGLSLERPTMIRYGVNNIRELLGHKTDLNFVENNPAVRLDTE